MALGRTEHYRVWLTPFGWKKNCCLILAASSLEVREQAHIRQKPSCLEGHGDEGRSALPLDRQIIYSKEMKKQARAMQSEKILFGPWENYGMSPFETHFWAYVIEEDYWKKPACIYQG